MLDLDPGESATSAMPNLVPANCSTPTEESHIAYRLGRRQAARLVRFAAVAEESGRLDLPEDDGVGARAQPWTASSI